MTFASNPLYKPYNTHHVQYTTPAVNISSVRCSSMVLPHLPVVAPDPVTQNHGKQSAGTGSWVVQLQRTKVPQALVQQCRTRNGDYIRTERGRNVLNESRWLYLMTYYMCPPRAARGGPRTQRLALTEPPHTARIRALPVANPHARRC